MKPLASGVALALAVLLGLGGCNTAEPVESSPTPVAAAAVGPGPIDEQGARERDVCEQAVLCCQAYVDAMVERTPTASRERLEQGCTSVVEAQASSQSRFCETAMLGWRLALRPDEPDACRDPNRDRQ